MGCTKMPEQLELATAIMERQPDSALKILRNIPTEIQLKNNERAIYGMLLFQAFDRTNQALPADSILNFSIDYFQRNNNKHELAVCYYFKARLYKNAQRNDDATLTYLKALDLIDSEDDLYLYGKIYSGMGDICNFQKDYKEALAKYAISLRYFQAAKDTIEVSYKLIDIGCVYRFLNMPDSTLYYFNRANAQVKDSLIYGLVNQEIGVDYYLSKEYETAQKYIEKSLEFPCRGTSFSIRYFVLADINYKLNKFDSAIMFANLALKHPNNFFIKRDCYRVLANSEYDKGNFDKSKIYMSNYQDCTDSVRLVEIQTKSTVLEDIHDVNTEFVKSKYFVLVLVIAVLLILIISFFIYRKMQIKHKQKEVQLESAEIQLGKTQSLLKERLIAKIEENKLQRATEFKKSTIKERERITKEIYFYCLHLDNWSDFANTMNQTFNDLFEKLMTINSDINNKDLTWCALFLLDVSSADICIILDSQQSSIYKLKQRLAQKLKLSGARELDQLLIALSENK